MPIEKNFNFEDEEKKIYDKWINKGYFAALSSSDKPKFSMVIPPPNVTGSLHMGHALNNTLQDILARYKRMDGYNVCWLPGTDHAGIATQNVVEKSLLKEGVRKEDLGREKFIEKVWEWKENYGSRIINQLKAIGSSCDWSRERFTMDEGLSKAVKKVFIKLYNDGLIYRGKYIINWCPRCLTALSDVECEHKDIQGNFYHIKYFYKDNPEKFAVIATTRPETMLGDTALAVHPDDERYKDLKGKKVILPIVNKEIPVIEDNYVDPSFGTGMLKITPAHDPNDFLIGQKHNLPVINIMNEDATLNDNVPERYKGLDRVEARKKIIEELKEKGNLIKVEPHPHSVGHCYRCSTMVEPYVSKQWFVSMKPLAAPAIKAVREGKIKFIPQWWSNTYFDWMENTRDWCISRQIWWGHRIPAYYCGGCGALIVSEDAPSKCSKCGSKDINQDKDVLDTWFSSALWPFSTFGWPEETNDLKTFYPTDVLSTGFDIIYFWVARMIVMGIYFMKEVPFKDVYIHALIRAEDGSKMSKSTGNVIDPLDMIKKYGCDALRFSLCAFAAQGRDIKLSEERIEGYKNFVNKIWNASRFLLMNNEENTEIKWNDTEKIEDEWILSELNKTVSLVRKNLNGYFFNDAAAALYDFFWHKYCDWYIEALKLRIYSGEELIKNTALQNALYILSVSLKLLHPFTPFITDYIYGEINPNVQSVMIEEYPKLPESMDESQNEFEGLMEIIKGVRNLRHEAGLPPSEKADISVFFKNDNLKKAALANLELLKSLAKINGLTFEKGEKNSLTYMLAAAEIYMPLSASFIKKEKERLSAEKEALEKEITKSERKLNNTQFMEKAKQFAIDREKQKYGEMAQKLKAVEERMNILK